MVAAYLAERLPLRLVLPVATLLSAAARVGSGCVPPWTAAWDAVAITGFFAQFRLWDDLADRERDRRRHPERALVRASSLRPFRVCAAALGILNAAIIGLAYRGVVPLALSAAIAMLTSLCYRAGSGRSIVRDHLLLLKYPVFTAIVATARPVGRPIALACAALAVYLGACLYEALHDRTSPLRRTPLVACEAALLVVCSWVVLEVRS